MFAVIANGTIIGYIASLPEAIRAAALATRQSPGNVYRIERI